jgi:hypothetical protein
MELFCCHRFDVMMMVELEIKVFSHRQSKDATDGRFAVLLHVRRRTTNNQHYRVRPIREVAIYRRTKGTGKLRDKQSYNYSE